mgnify:CR=1 FL=1
MVYLKIVKKVGGKVRGGGCLERKEEQQENGLN